mmetsp:Transcript_7734/g.21173  ORF Transcript_7734/g.21173 Transcript_7734/m.21173 type:complete len:223 (+) Transcript_7734:101-769(+)
MKFGKMMRATVQSRMPSWEAYVLDYKGLKQLLNQLVDEHDAKAAQAVDEEMMMDDDPLGVFTERLDTEVEKINDFYMDRIEEGVIILHAMTQNVEALAAANVSDTAQVAALQRALVSYHFNLLMLQNYVALNFTGVVKILKKLDKKFSSDHRKVYLASIVELPFYNCAALGQVVEDTEGLFGKLEQLMNDCQARLKVPCSQPQTETHQQVDGRQGAPMAQSV